jgi:type IV pilus assembly protein PilV
MRMNKPLSARADQHGVMLVEVLIALLVFSVGVLGLVGLQASAVQQSSQARYRTEAMLLANDLFGQMWVAPSRTAAALAANFGSVSAGTGYVAWKTKVASTLPGSTTHPPEVVVTPIAPLFSIVAGASAPAAAELTPTARVTITVRWKAPSDGASDPVRQYVAITEFRE